MADLCLGCLDSLGESVTKEKSYFSGFLKISSQLHDTDRPFVVASHLSVFIPISFSVSAVAKTKAAAFVMVTLYRFAKDHFHAQPVVSDMSSIYNPIIV